MENPRHWRLNPQRLRLIGEECSECGEKIFPPRDLCPRCKKDSKTNPYQFSGRGEVFSFTKVFQDGSPNPSANTPYYLALIRLEEGPFIIAQLTDLDPSSEPEIGMKVEMVTRILKEDGKAGTIIYGYKFRPRIGEGSKSERIT